MLAEVAARAAAEHVSYLELMVAADGGAGAARGMAAGWDPDLARLRDTLLAAGFRDAVVSAARSRLDRPRRRAARAAQVRIGRSRPGCGVTVRYSTGITRASAAGRCLREMLAGFEIAAADPRVVGVNLVQPEDDPRRRPRLLAPDVDARFPARAISGGEDRAARGRADRGPGRAGNAALPHPRIGA